MDIEKKEKLQQVVSESTFVEGYESEIEVSSVDLESTPDVVVEDGVNQEEKKDLVVKENEISENFDSKYSVSVGYVLTEEVGDADYESSKKWRDGLAKKLAA